MLVDDVPVEFLPDHTPRQDIHDVNPLSVVYEVCRYWEKSLAIYELLNL